MSDVVIRLLDEEIVEMAKFQELNKKIEKWKRLCDS